MPYVVTRGICPNEDRHAVSELLDNTSVCTRARRQLRAIAYDLCILERLLGRRLKIKKWSLANFNE